MEPVTVGIREFRGNLAAHLLESQGPVAITRHGDYDRILHPGPRQAHRSETCGAREGCYTAGRERRDLG